jgi:hypothetical protein
MAFTRIRQSSPNPDSSTKEPTRKQHDRTATSVVTLQYSSATFVSLRFKSHKVKFGTRFKINHYFCFNFFKNWVKSKIGVRQGVTLLIKSATYDKQKTRSIVRGKNED